MNNSSFSLAKILLGVNVIWILLKYIEVLNSCYKKDKKKSKSFFELKYVSIENKKTDDPFMSLAEILGKYSQKSKTHILEIRNILIHPLGDRSNKKMRYINYDKY